MKALLCKLLFSCTLAAPGAKPIDELTYGTVLYDYFQEDYSAALVTTLVADAQQRLGQDPVRFSLARGSFAFQEGLYDLAASTFASLDPGELSELDRLRLSFHLGREYHRRGDWESLRQQLDGIQLGKRWWGQERAHPEVEFMRAELAIQDRRFADALALLDAIDAGDPLKAYGLFNLGVALRNQPQAAAAAQLTASTAFAELARLPASTAESYDLVQRGKLALAYLARTESPQGDTGPIEAAAVLEELPVNGRYRNAALAAYGSLAMEQGEYELAARVWLTLKQEPFWTPSTAAARLGFPLSLENLASRELALTQYRRAEATFVNRLDALSSLERRVTDPQWVRTLIETFAGDSLQTAEAAAALERWQDELGHTDWLEWLATEPVNELLKDWRDLRDEQAWLSQLPGELDALEEVALEQVRRGQVAQQLLVTDDRIGARDRSLVQLTDLAQRLAQFAEVAPDRQWGWMQEIGTEEERALLTDLEAKVALVSEHMQEPERSRWLHRIARLQGVTFWQQTLEHSSRLQQRRRALAENRDLLATLDGSLLRLDRAEDVFTAGVGIDFARLRDRSVQLGETVAVAITDREQRLAGEIQRGMRQEMAQVRRYLLVARVAIARTTDQLALGTNETAQQEPGQ